MDRDYGRRHTNLCAILCLWAKRIYRRERSYRINYSRERLIYCQCLHEEYSIEAMSIGRDAR